MEHVISDMPVQNIKSKNFAPYNIFLIGFLSSLAGLLFGLDIGVISGANIFIKQDFSATNYEIEKIVSFMMLGAALGAFFCGWASAKFGRNPCLILSATLFITSSIGCAFSDTIKDLIIWRFILGIAVGIASTSAPLYISEIAPKEKRGAMISSYQLMVTLGILLAFISNSIFGYWGLWRWMLGITIIPAILFLIGLLFLPNSPRWLILNKHKQEAYYILSTIRTGEDSTVQKEVRDIELQIQNPKNGLKLFLSNSNFKRSVILGIFLQAIQQFTGINFVIYYTPRIFADIGYQGYIQLWFTVLVGLVNVIATFITINTCDKFGRKPILYIGFSIMAFSFSIISLLLSHKVLTNNLLQYLCVMMILLFIIGFALSAGPLIWTICSEIQPLQGRDFGVSASTITNWLANFFVGSTFLTLNDDIGASKIFLFYACLNILFLFFTYLFIPETSNVSLEQIEENLMDGKPLRKIGR